MSASSRGNLETVKLLVDSGAKVNESDPFGMSPIIGAAASGNRDVVTFLKSKGAKVSPGDLERMYTIMRAFGSHEEAKEEINKIRSVLGESADDLLPEIPDPPAQTGKEIRDAVVIVWREFIDALKAGETKKALGYIASHERQKYTEIFEAMGPENVKKAFSNGSQLFFDEEIDANAPFVKCSIIRTRDGKEYSFAVILVREIDGIWRITSF